MNDDDDYNSDDDYPVDADDNDASSETSTVLITALPPVPSTSVLVQIEQHLMHRCVALTHPDRDISQYTPSEIEWYLHLWPGNLSSIFGEVIACYAHNHEVGLYTFIYEFRLSVNARDCIDSAGEYFPDVRIYSLLHTPIIYFERMMQSFYTHDVGVDANGDSVVPMPHPSPVHLHELVEFVVNAPPRSIDSDENPGIFINAVVCPSSGGSRASIIGSIDEITHTPDVTPIPGDGTFLRHAGTPFRLQMGDM